MCQHSVVCKYLCAVVQSGWSHLGNRITQSGGNPQWKPSSGHPKWCGELVTPTLHFLHQFIRALCKIQKNKVVSKLLLIINMRLQTQYRLLVLMTSLWKSTRAVVVLSVCTFVIMICILWSESSDDDPCEKWQGRWRCCQYTIKVIMILYFVFYST